MSCALSLKLPKSLAITFRKGLIRNNLTKTSGPTPVKETNIFKTMKSPLRSPGDCSVMFNVSAPNMTDHIFTRTQHHILGAVSKVDISNFNVSQNRNHISQFTRTNSASFKIPPKPSNRKVKEQTFFYPNLQNPIIKGNTWALKQMSPGAVDVTLNTSIL